MYDIASPGRYYTVRGHIAGGCTELTPISSCLRFVSTTMGPAFLTLVWLRRRLSSSTISSADFFLLPTILNASYDMYFFGVRR